ncbi:hypothetical protein ES703_84984 [subsurface metagenome]
MPYIPGKGWTSIVTGQVEPVAIDDFAMSGVYAATPAQQMRYTPGAGPGGTVLPPGGGLPPIATAGLPALAAIPAALGITMPAWLTAILGAAAVGYGGYQALGGGEGGGLFGLNILGGDEFEMGGLEFGGPGLPEPLQPYSEWHIGNKQFYYVPQYNPSGSFKHAKIAMYNRDTKKWKTWTLPKPHLAVIGKNMPRHQMLTRLRRNLKRHTADAKTILKLTSPQSLESYHKPGGRYVKGRKRYID